MMRVKRKRERFGYATCDVSFRCLGWRSYSHKVTCFITVRVEIGSNYVSSRNTKEYLPLPSSTTPADHLSVINHICHTSDGPCVPAHSGPTSPLRLRWKEGTTTSWGERNKRARYNWNVLHAGKKKILLEKV